MFGRQKRSLAFIEPTIGIRFSSQGLKANKDKANDQSAILGINFRITPFRIYYLWTWNIGLHYTQNSFDSSYDNRHGVSSFNSNRITRLRADYSTVSLPLSLEYTLPLKRVKPYFMGGVEPLYSFNTDHQVIDIKRALVRENEQFRKIHIGAFIGTDLRCEFGSNYAKLMVQYAIRRPLAQSGFIFDYHHVTEWRFALAVGLKVKGEGAEFED